MENETRKQAEKLAAIYCERFNDFNHLRIAALNNLVNSNMGRVSNDYIVYFWQYVNNNPKFKS